MIFNYSKAELKDKNNFNFLYRFLTQYDCYVVASKKNIDLTVDFFTLSHYLVSDGYYIKFQHHGSSATKATKANLSWLIKTIFCDCNNFAIVDRATYNKLFIASLNDYNKKNTIY